MSESNRARTPSAVTPHRIPANGVPWLEWLADGSWRCARCGETGRLPEFIDVASYARQLGGIKRHHAGCGTWDDLDSGEVGHPLNPDRQVP